MRSPSQFNGTAKVCFLFSYSRACSKQVEQALRLAPLPHIIVSSCLGQDMPLLRTSGLWPAEVSGNLWLRWNRILTPSASSPSEIRIMVIPRSAMNSTLNFFANVALSARLAKVKA